MVRGLSNGTAATLIGARAEQPYQSIDDLWRRAGVPVAALVQIAEADAFLPSLQLSRRAALWAIKALRDEPLPLFAAAAAREASPVSEIQEPAVALRRMADGSEVAEDYRHVGLSLRRHPVAFLRADLHRQGMVTCVAAMGARDGRWLRTAGIVLVRQRPGSAKGVLFVTIEDESGIANLVVWPPLYEKQRGVVLAADMLGVQGRIQREGEVVHLVAYTLRNLSALLQSVSERDDGPIEAIKVKARDFR
jgi:error-prone DNA polymerase